MLTKNLKTFSVSTSNTLNPVMLKFSILEAFVKQMQEKKQKFKNFDICILLNEKLLTHQV